MHQLAAHIPVIGALTAIVVTLLATPWIMRLASVVGAIDRPDARKIHQGAIPRLGGAAVALGIATAFMVQSMVLGGVPDFVAQSLVPVALGSLTVLAIGAFDDIRPLGAAPKFAAQILAAVIAWHGGIEIHRLTVPFTDYPLELGALSLPATILWVVLVTNAWNIIDGMDGLAATLGVVAASIFCLMLIVRGQDAALFFVAPLVGALVGFLPYNLHPARVFLGDSGSYLIGYQLALVSIVTSQKGIASFAIFGPMAILGLPLLDVGIAIFRRILRPEPMDLRARVRGIFRADRGHVHHRALDRGWSQPRALLILSSISGLFGLLGLTLTFWATPRSGGILLIVTVIFVILLYSGSAREVIRASQPPKAIDDSAREEASDKRA